MNVELMSTSESSGGILLLSFKEISVLQSGEKPVPVLQISQNLELAIRVWKFDIQERYFIKSLDIRYCTFNWIQKYTLSILGSLWDWLYFDFIDLVAIWLVKVLLTEGRMQFCHFKDGSLYCEAIMCILVFLGFG